MDYISFSKDMEMLKKIIIGAMLISSSSLFAVETDPTVATVNGQPIKFSTFDQNYKQNLLVVTEKKITKEKVLTDMINRELGIAKAKKLKLDQDPVVKQKMEDVLFHAMVSKDLEPLLLKITVTDDEVKKYYADHKEYRTAHILLRTKAVPDKEENEAALAKALEIYNQVIKKPNTFAEQANKYSQSSTAPNGGDLGFQPAVRYAPEYFDAIKAKPVGFISTPVKTQFGYHIIKVLGIRDVKEIDSSLYKKMIYDFKRDKIIEDYFSGLRKEGSIKIEKKYLE